MLPNVDVHIDNVHCRYNIICTNQIYCPQQSCNSKVPHSGHADLAIHLRERKPVMTIIITKPNMFPLLIISLAPRHPPTSCDFQYEK